MVGYYFVFLLIPLVLGLAVQGWLKSTFARNSKVAVRSGLSGADVARRVLDQNGLSDVQVLPSKAGPLSDHYDPRKRTVNLSQPVFAGRSVAATAVAAHEVGHAIQHATAYAPMRARTAIWPIAAFSSQAWMFFLIGGFFIANLSGQLFTIALILYAFAVLFQIVTLPVEFNASGRAKAAGRGSRPRRRARAGRRQLDADRRGSDVRRRRAGGAAAVALPLHARARLSRVGGGAAAARGPPPHRPHRSRRPSPPHRSRHPLFLRAVSSLSVSLCIRPALASSALSILATAPSQPDARAAAIYAFKASYARIRRRGT